MAQFFVSLDISFSTPGPVRSGFLVLSHNLANNNGADGPDAETFNATLGSFDLSHILFGAGTAPPSPFTLGQDFLFHEDLMMRATANSTFGIYECLARDPGARILVVCWLRMFLPAGVRTAPPAP